MDSFRVIALDPGGTTGVAVLQADYADGPRGGELTNIKWTRFQLDQPNHHNDLFCLLRDNWAPYYYIVCESFEYRNDSRAGLELISKEYIGVVQLFAQRTDMTENLFFQTASQGACKPNNFVKNANLKNLGILSASVKHRHAMDATAHLLYWIINGDSPVVLRPYRLDLLNRGWGSVSNG